MATLQQEIAESFLTKLEESEHVDSQQVEQLRALLTDTKKPKADDILKILSPTGGGDVK
jgi:hypothetical protein